MRFRKLLHKVAQFLWLWVQPYKSRNDSVLRHRAQRCGAQFIFFWRHFLHPLVSHLSFALAS